MTEATITFRVDETLKAQFTTTAKAKDRTGTQLMREFVRQQQEEAEHYAWFHCEVQVGVDAANAGDVISAEEIEAEATAWRAKTRRKLAGTAS